MELDTVMNKIIRSKPFGLSIVKGALGSGKTTTAMYRILHLKNNYCLYDEDGILLISCGKEDSITLRDHYNKTEEDNIFDYISLFSNTRDNLHIYNINDIVNKYFLEYKRVNNLEFSIIQDINIKESFLRECLIELRFIYKKVRVLNENYTKFLLDEIGWIKACNYVSLEEYKQAARTGRRYKRDEGPQRVIRNSKARAAIYDLMLLYDKKLRDNNYIDNEDMLKMALKQVTLSPFQVYTHVIVDECQDITRLELELLRALCHNKPYSSMMFTLDIDKTNNPLAWIIKGRKINSLGFTSPSRTYALNKVYTKQVESSNINEKIDNQIQNIDFLENYEYIDIKHNRKFHFSREIANISEVTVKDSNEEQLYTTDELKNIPVFSDIAAGEPIFMSQNQEANFFMPKCWLKGIDDCFMLKVKGDSMIGAEIEHGDYVILKRKHVAQNRDIVAVEINGGATLKRLSLGEKGAFLMPENPKYRSISLYGIDANILGIAVGIIKSK